MAADVDTSYTADIMKTLYQFSREKIFTDFTIHAGDKTAHCHSAILAAKSTYFNAICVSGLHEATLERSISREDGDTLDTVIKFMYLGKSNITVQNVEKVVLAAEFLHHEEMKSECENIMLRNLDVSKLMSFHKLSQKADLPNLKTACLHLAKDKFTKVAHTKWFLALTTDEAVEYLQADDLNVATEDDVLYAIIRYINNSNEAGPVSEQYIKRLFSCARLKFCRRSTLESLSEDETILGPLRLKIFEFLNHGRHGEGTARKSYSAVHSVSAASEELPRASVPGTDSREKFPLPAKATSKMTAKASAKVPTPAKVPVASPLKTKEEVLIVGGARTSFIQHVNIVFLDKDPKDCIMTKAPIFDEAGNSSVCASKDALFVSGGYDFDTQRSMCKIQMFSLTDRRWVDLPDLPFPVDCHGSAYVNDKLYTLGGRYQENGQIKHWCTSVNVLNLSSLSWAECQSLPIAVESPGIIAVEEEIYGVGGHSGKEWSCQTVKLNIRTGAITQCQSMPEGECVHYSMVAVSRYIYGLACSFFLQYDITRDQWTKLTMPLKPSNRPAVVLQNNHVIMLGGYEKDRKDPNDVIQKYDLSSKTWSLETSKMPLPLQSHWAFVMDIPQAK